MALSENATKLANLFDPQVVGEMIDRKLINRIKFTPLARVDTTLEGRPGSTITLPVYSYIGPAEDVEEGEAIPIAQLNQSTVEVKIKQAGKGVEVSDWAVLNGYGDPLSEAVDQILLSISDKVEIDTIATLEGIGADMTVTGTISADTVNTALVKFGEELEGNKVLLISAEDYAVLRKASDWVPNTEIGAEAVIRGRVGMIYGCEVVVTDRLKGKNEAFIVKPGALAIYLKRGATVESDRDIVYKSTVITADKYYVTYLYDSSKAIKITTTAGA